jgi:hypothetical protein
MKEFGISLFELKCLLYDGFDRFDLRPSIIGKWLFNSFFFGHKINVEFLKGVGSCFRETFDTVFHSIRDEEEEFDFLGFFIIVIGHNYLRSIKLLRLIYNDIIKVDEIVFKNCHEFWCQ